MPVSDIKDDVLLRRAVRGITNIYAYPAPRWTVVSQVFGLGSTYAAELCRRFDLDPDERLPRGKLLRAD